MRCFAICNDYPANNLLGIRPEEPKNLFCESNMQVKGCKW